LNTKIILRLQLKKIAFCQLRVRLKLRLTLKVAGVVYLTGGNQAAVWAEFLTVISKFGQFKCKQPLLKLKTRPTFKHFKSKLKPNFNGVVFALVQA